MGAVAIAAIPIPALCETIKALVVKGDYATEKAEQFYIAAGKHLEELKERCPKEWVELAEKEIGLRRRRAYDYIALASGKKSLVDMRSKNAERNKKARRASRDAQKANSGHIPNFQDKSKPLNFDAMRSAYFSEAAARCLTEKQKKAEVFALLDALNIQLATYLRWSKLKCQNCST